jgi:hypothetical protein
MKLKNVPDYYEQRLQAFPAVLRRLVEAELAAGNEIVEFSGGFPAPPVGDCVKLARAVTTQPRATAAGLDFYDRNMPGYSGEFTDAKRFFFVLEPPNPPAPPPDMDAIRAELEARQQSPKVKPASRRRKSADIRQEPNDGQSAALIPRTKRSSRPQTTVDRFRQSMEIDYEKWHEGIGYDLSLLKTATPEELVEIENLLVARGASDWRDVEALAALNSPRARVALRSASKCANHEVRVAVLSYAPDVISSDERTETLVAALQVAEIYGGLSSTLLEVEEFHPRPVVDALLRGVLARGGDIATHYAAMLMFLHGKATSAFDWDQRPFFLKFNTDDRSVREAMFRELCSKIGIQAEKYLPPQ